MESVCSEVVVVVIVVVVIVVVSVGSAINMLTSADPETLVPSLIWKGK